MFGRVGCNGGRQRGAAWVTASALRSSAPVRESAGWVGRGVRRNVAAELDEGSAADGAVPAVAATPVSMASRAARERAWCRGRRARYERSRGGQRDDRSSDGRDPAGAAVSGLPPWQALLAAQDAWKRGVGRRSRRAGRASDRSTHCAVRGRPGRDRPWGCLAGRYHAAGDRTPRQRRGRPSRLRPYRGGSSSDRPRLTCNPANPDLLLPPRLPRLVRRRCGGVRTRIRSSGR